MRTKKAIYNNIAAALLQVTTLIFGLIIPRLMIGTYGSQLNGLVSSTKQVVSYLRYLEMGITSVLVFTLYEHLANYDYDNINPLVSRSKKEYEKISLGYFILVTVLSLIYPILLKENLGYGFVALIVFLIGIYGALDFYTLSKYRVLLQADQRYYVVNMITIVTTILQNVTTIVLIYLKQPIYMIVLLPTIFLPLRNLFLRKYVKKKYSEINFKEAPSAIKLESRKDAFITGIADTVNVSLPIVIVSLLVSLEMASVFSVYNMVFMGLTAIISVFTTGLQSAFGNMFAKNETKTILRSNDNFQFLLYILISILYATALTMIIPFIKLYIGGITDVDNTNYIYPIYGILFTVWSILHNSRLPNHAIINASGNWKITTRTNVIQMILFLISAIVLGYFWGVTGILISMILATIFKFITLMILTNKKILFISNKKTVLRLFRVFFIVILVNLPIYLGLVKVTPNSFIQWGIISFVVVIISSFITILLNLIFDWPAIKRLYNRYINKNRTKKEIL